MKLSTKDFEDYDEYLYEGLHDIAIFIPCVWVAEIILHLFVDTIMGPPLKFIIGFILIVPIIRIVRMFVTALILWIKDEIEYLRK